MKAFKSLSFYIVIIAIIIIVATLLGSFAGAEEMHYSELLEQIQADNVKSIVLEDDMATVKLKDDSVVKRENDKGVVEDYKLKSSVTYEVTIISADEFQAYITTLLAIDADGEV